MRTGRNTSGLAKKSCRQDYNQNRSDKRRREWVNQLWETRVYNCDKKYEEQAIRNLKKYYYYTDEDIAKIGVKH